MLKKSIIQFVFGANVIYGLWELLRLLGGLFILGSNDTPLEIVGLLALGLMPISAALLSVRYRKLAILGLAIAMVLNIVGIVDNDFFLAKKYGHPIAIADSIRFAVTESVWASGFLLFYSFAEAFRWPLLSPVGFSETHCKF